MKVEGVFWWRREKTREVMVYESRYINEDLLCQYNYNSIQPEPLCWRQSRRTHLVKAQPLHLICAYQYARNKVEYRLARISKRRKVFTIDNDKVRTDRFGVFDELEFLYTL